MSRFVRSRSIVRSAKKLETAPADRCGADNGRHCEVVTQTMGRHCEVVKFTTFCYSERDGGGRPQKLSLFAVTKCCKLGAVGLCNFLIFWRNVQTVNLVLVVITTTALEHVYNGTQDHKFRRFIAA